MPTMKLLRLLFPALVLVLTGLVSMTPLHAEDEPDQPAAAMDESETVEPPTTPPAENESTAEPANSEPAAKRPRSALIEVTGMIDRRQMRYVERVINEALDANVDMIVTRIESPGGELFAALDLLEMVIEKSSGAEAPRMVAWIDKEAYSAAALLAYGHHEIYMRGPAIIGDIGIIFRGQDGEIKYAQEKIETAVRAIMRSTAEQRDWDKAQLLKMTARNQELHEARFPDGRVEYVIQDDRGSFLADHPEIDPDDPQQWVLIAGEDRLITYTGNEAVARGMATGVLEDIDALWAQLGVDSDTVIDLQPTTVEMTARKLGALAPIFISLAILFVLFEFKTPGVGIFAILAAVCGGIFFFMQYYQDLATNWALIAIALGLILVLVEIFSMAGGGLLGLAGGLLALAGIFGAFLPSNFDWDFDNQGASEAIHTALINLGVVFVITIGGMATFIALAPRLPFLDRISNLVSIQGTSTSDWEKAVDAHQHSGQAAQRGVVVAECHPSGTVTIDGRNHSARAEHSIFIPSGTTVEIIGSQFGELIVRPLAKHIANPEQEANA